MEDEDIKQDHLVELAENIRRGNKRYHNILVENSHFTLDDIQRLCKDEKYFSAKEALEAKLIDGILDNTKKGRKIKKTKKRVK
jgi:ATP-dependent protease ClpP protease subunit